MIFEYSLEFRKLYFYSFVNADGLIPERFKVIHVETSGNIVIYTIEREYVISEQLIVDLASHIKEIYCSCNKTINYQSLSLLPSHNWHEYIDLWSCHNSEFKSTLNFTPKARKNCIILGSFFMISDKHIYCCKCYKDRIFYNEVNMSISNDDIIYMAFCKYFESNTYFYINERTEIILFGKSYIGDTKNGRMYPALKVGFKSVKSIERESELMNDFFRKRIFHIMEKNKIDIKILDYDISFIPKSTPAKVML
ncbi:hypothetical protein THOM_0192 [Trachipleistophora hominis]|uniref:Uncharacterized protein n=1 Tax=Trachipleistophora hominis TaxID=72359 RepID=L7JZC0_TRAHO|nr:hypothetical protein THOM_0192 [Trachipleistophora hominis]